MSPSLSAQLGRIMIRKMVNSAVRRMRSWTGVMTDKAKRISFMLRGATWAERFTPAFVFPNCPSALSTAGILFDFSSTPDESESGESAPISTTCHFKSFGESNSQPSLLE